jgi:choline dehydrogenase-like flavoprotein
MLRDRAIMNVIEDSAFAALRNLQQPLKRLFWFLESKADPNDWRVVERNGFGICYAPLTTRVSNRMGSRERILDIARRFPERLQVELDALASRVLFDANQRAVGVEYLKGRHLYRAHAKPSSDPGEKRQACAAREVILCGGAFNTPQLLLLSGIGPRQELERHGIEVRVDLPGVGSNLQDRYEVSVVHRMKDDWGFLAGAKFTKGDRQFAAWENSRSGVYATSGGLLAVINRSRGSQPLPDLFLISLLARFEGYFPGYSKLISDHGNYLSWIVLKAHTLNNAGTVTLRSADPRDPPRVDFRYFEEGSDSSGADLDAVVDGIKFVREMTADLKKEGTIVSEELPGERHRSVSIAPRKLSMNDVSLITNTWGSAIGRDSNCASDPSGSSPTRSMPTFITLPVRLWTPETTGLRSRHTARRIRSILSRTSFPKSRWNRPNRNMPPSTVPSVLTSSGSPSRSVSPAPDPLFATSAAPGL